MSGQLITGDFIYKDAANSCEYNAFGSMLKFYNVERMEYVLGQRIDFQYQGFDQSQEIRFPIDDQQLPQMLKKYYGMVINRYHSEDNQYAWDQVQNLIDRGSPVIVLVDVHYMKYHLRHQGIRFPHMILIHGYNPDLQTLHIVDNSSDFVGEIDFKDFLQGWAVEFKNFYEGERNIWFEVRAPQQELKINIEDFRKILKKNHQRMKRSSGTDIHVGITGIEQFLAELPLWMGEKVESLVAGVKYTTNEWAILFQQRKRHAEMLKWGYGFTAASYLEKLAQIMELLAQEYEMIRNLLAKISVANFHQVSEELVKKHLARVKSRTEKIMQLEKEYLEIIETEVIGEV